MSTRKEIQIPYYYDPQSGLLYNSPTDGKPVRTQFFSDEQTRSLHKHTKVVPDKPQRTSIELPMVTVIIPTTRSRDNFNSRIYTIMHFQDYAHKEIIFDYGDGKIGEKRNRICSQAQGDIIIHADSDDIYQDDWISKSVNALITNDAAVTGMDNINFWSPEAQIAWRYNPNGKTWLSGATMCYWKKTWEKHPFPDKQIGEDTAWIKTMPAGLKIHRHDYIDGFLATIHPGNTAGKMTDDTAHYKKFGTFELEQLKKIWQAEYLR